MQGIISVEPSRGVGCVLRRNLLRRRRRRIVAHAVDEAYCFQNYVTADLQAFSTQLIHGVLNRVMEAVVVAVIDIDDIENRNTGAGEWDVVIFHGGCGSKEMGLIAEASRGLKQKIFQPPGRVFIAADIKIGVANHICQNERFHFLAGAVILQLFCQMTAAPQRIVGVPLAGERFFAVQEGDPDAVSFQLFAAKLVSDGQQKSAGCRAVIGADERRIAQPVIGFLVRAQQDNAIFGAGKLGNNIGHGHLARRSLGDK